MKLEEILKEIEENEAVMLYFWGENCNVCDALKPKIKSLLDKEFPKIKQLYINAKKNPQIASHFSVFSIPTTIIFLDKKEFIREGRNLSIMEFKEKLKRPYEIFFN